jgi:tetratricopeptide (TPR) repeat protein
MSKNNNSEKKTLREKFQNTLSANRKVIISLSILIVVIIAVSVIYVEVSSSLKTTEISTIEALEADFSEYKKLENENDILERRDLLVSNAENVFKDYPTSYAGQRALIISGQLYEDTEDWEKALDFFQRASNINPKSHLITTTLIHAYQNSERIGDLAAAKTILKRIIDDNNTESIESPRALFNLGRISEIESNSNDAIEFYNQLVLEYPNSGWTNLAQDRIIYLTIKGVVQKDS